MITLIIIAITCGVSLLTMENPELKNKYMFNAYAIAHHREWWRFLSHGLLHANFMHLFFNMYAFYLFGTFVENTFKDDLLFGKINGEMIYLLLYVGGLIVSSIYSYFKHKDDRYYNALGASGAVSAVIYSSILLNPLSKIYIMAILGMPAWIFGFLYLGISWYLARKNVGNIGHDAHFWGAVYGFILPIAFKPELFQDFVAMIKAFFMLGGFSQ